MDERKVVGWVVVLLPERKGEARKWECGDRKGMTFDKSKRVVWDKSIEAFDALHSLIDDVIHGDEERARIRVMPVYARRKRTVAQERADVVAWLEKKFDRKVADKVAEGAHVGAAK